MTAVLKVYGVLGMLLSLLLIVLSIRDSIEHNQPIPWDAVAFCSGLFLVWWRCFCLRRVAAILGGLFCGWLAYIGYFFATWEWIAFWGLTTMVLTLVTVFAWKELKPGI